MKPERTANVHDGDFHQSPFGLEPAPGLVAKKAESPPRILPDMGKIPRDLQRR